ncbi:MAG: 50S ribosomal protein L23 [Bacteroidales bacterium]|jgi:large subunit ribosomal protein L23|nr:50S ribosomal protein L23 [Bacteroidales bacterium]MCR5192185.1 50S ribosomal protein L23 [Bacteroidales bacterium]
MNIIVKPLISEKMTRLTEAAAEPKLNRIQRHKGLEANPVQNRYGFIVDKRANKIEIKKAVEEFYNVKVVDVNTMNYSGKSKSRYTKAGFLQGRTNAFKKAIVTLAPDNTIDFYSGI